MALRVGGEIRKKLLWSGRLVAAASLYFLLRRWGTRRGATANEYTQRLLGDAIVPRPHLETTHAITIHTAPESVWPWLVQLGYHRGACTHCLAAVASDRPLAD